MTMTLIEQLAIPDLVPGPYVSLHRLDADRVRVSCRGWESDLPLTASRESWGQNESRLDDEVKRAWDSLSSLPRDAPALLGAGSEWRWQAVLRLSEACSRVAARLAENRSDVRVDLPLFLRLRFLMLSAPFRFPGYQKDLVFAPEEAAARAREARILWAACLLERDEHVKLLHWPDRARGAGHKRTLDDEARDLLWRGPSSTRRTLSWPRTCPRRRRPLELVELHGSRTSRAFALFFAREYFLRRFMLLDALRVVCRRRTRRGSLAAGAFLGLVAIGLVWPFGACVVLLAGADPSLSWFAWPAVSAYALALVGVVFCGIEMSYPLCLRLPAAAALGAAVLASLGTRWIGIETWHPTLAFVLIAFGYLMVEAVSHGSLRLAAATRALAVLTVGWMHAVAVVAIAMWAMGPLLFTGDTTIDFSGDTLRETLPLAASIVLALGVFLQVLWEDRPVTYPLAHLEWRGRNS